MKEEVEKGEEVKAEANGSVVKEEGKAEAKDTTTSASPATTEAASDSEKDKPKGILKNADEVKAA